MRKEWLWIGVAAVLLSACTAPTTEQQAPQQPYNGPVVEIGGVEPQYEPYNPNNMQD
jgi:rare lipoprotein A